MILQTTVEKQSNQSNKLIFKITDSIVDRAGDRVYIPGLDTRNFLANPVCLWNHEQNNLPIGRWVKLEKFEDYILAELEIYESDDLANNHTEFCKTVKDQLERGFIKTVSIATLDKEVYPNEFGGDDIFSAELIEISIVTIPANARAVKL